jgi:hypothetical protein
MNTEKDLLESLNEQQKALFLKIKKKQKTKEKPVLTYAEKNLELFEKFFAGEATLVDFKRDSRKKDDEGLRYYFMRGEKKNIKGEVTKEAKTCFQTKTFVQDMLIAKAMLESDVDHKERPIGWQQRFAVMRYELIKFLKSTSKKPRGGEGVEVVVAKKDSKKSVQASIKAIETAKKNIETIKVKPAEIEKPAKKSDPTQASARFQKEGDLPPPSFGQT